MVVTTNVEDSPPLATSTGSVREMAAVVSTSTLSSSSSSSSASASGESYVSAMAELLYRDEVSIPWSEVDFPKMVAYGSAMYMAECLILHPAEVVKTRLQVDLQTSTSLAKQAKDEITSLHRAEGTRGFFRAFGFNTFLSIPAHLAFISTYSSLKEHTEHGKLEYVAPFLAGGAAEVVAAVCLVPLDVVFNRAVTQTVPVKDRIGCFAMGRRIVREEGTRGLFRGFGAHLAMFIPASGIWWSSYEGTKKLLHEHFPDRRGMQSQLIAGCFAGGIAAAVTNPLEVAKVRLQTQIGVSECGSITGTLKRMLVKEGISSFGKGLLPKLLFMVPVSAISSILYESAMTLSRKEPAAASSS